MSSAWVIGLTYRHSLLMTRVQRGLRVGVTRRMSSVLLKPKKNSLLPCVSSMSKKERTKRNNTSPNSTCALVITRTVSPEPLTPLPN